MILVHGFPLGSSLWACAMGQSLKSGVRMLCVQFELAGSCFRRRLARLLAGHRRKVAQRCACSVEVWGFMALGLVDFGYTSEGLRPERDELRRGSRCRCLSLPVEGLSTFQNKQDFLLCTAAEPRTPKP